MSPSPDQVEHKGGRDDILRQNLEVFTNFGNLVKTTVQKELPNASCQQYAVAMYRLMMNSGLNPLIDIVVDKTGTDKHYFVEAEGVALDLEPAAHGSDLRIKRRDEIAQRMINDIIQGKILVIPTESKEYRLLTEPIEGSVVQVRHTDKDWVTNYQLDFIDEEVINKIIPKIDKESRALLDRFKRK